MSNQDDLEQRFRQLERETLGESSMPPGAGQKNLLAELWGWIDRQTGVTKLVALGFVAVAAFMVLSLVLRLISLAVSLAIMLLVLFVLYKLFWDKPAGN
ncbi:MAG: hypothetical protein SFT94_01205 [Pseudanabaenaceae cyanobacterium bins.68]|nr:hypothetical protein [Pseudanabaenaceae cyanobacterium bins.68]